MTTVYNPNVVLDGLDFYIDFANPKSYNPNVFPNPTDAYAFFNGKVLNNCTIARDYISTPVPGGIPMLMTQTGQDPYAQGNYSAPTGNLSATIPGDIWVWQYWVKADAPCTIDSFIWYADSSGAYISTNQQFLGGTSATNSITTEWKRIFVIGQSTDPAVAYVQCRLDGESGTATIGRKIWFDGVNVTRIQTGTAGAPRFYPTLGNLLTVNSCMGNIYTATASASDRFHPAGYTVLDGVGGLSANNTTNMPATWKEQWQLELWFYVPTGATWGNAYNGPFFSKGSTVGTHGLFRSSTTNYVGLWLRHDSGSYSPTVLIERDKWYDLVGTWDGNTNTISLYLNGVQISSSVLAPVPAGIPDTGNFSVCAGGGTLSGSNGTQFIGNMAIARRYNRALQAAEVQQNFQALRGRFGI